MGLAPMETIHEVQRSVLDVKDVKRMSEWTLVSPKKQSKPDAKRSKPDAKRTSVRSTSDVRGMRKRINGHHSWAAAVKDGSSRHSANLSSKRSMLRQ